MLHKFCEEYIYGKSTVSLFLYPKIEYSVTFLHAEILITLELM